MISPKTVSLLILLLMLMQGVQSASHNFRWYCELGGQPITELRWDPEEQAYVPTSEDQSNNNYGGAKSRALNSWKDIDEIAPDDSEEDDPFSSLLRGGTSEETIYLEQQQQQAALSVISSPRKLEGNITNVNTNNLPNVLARRCPCWKTEGLHSRDFYCPMERTHCGLSAVSNPYGNSMKVYNDDPGCVDITKQQSFARNVWPIVTVWYLVMVLCLCLTRPGRHAMGCCLSKLWPRWNVLAVDRILRHSPEFARVIFRPTPTELAQEGAHHARTNRLMNNAGFEVTFELTSISRPPTEELLLRTRTFRYDQTKNTNNLLPSSNPGNQGDSCEATDIPDPNHDDNDNDETGFVVSCTICHLELEDGERVGDLPCGHTFHIHCLKSWIARRNVCPLCLAENIATPRHPPAQEQATIHQTATIHHLPEMVVSGE